MLKHLLLFSFVFCSIIYTIQAAPAAMTQVDHDDELEMYCENYLESADTLNAELPKICLAKGN